MATTKDTKDTKATEAKATEATTEAPETTPFSTFDFTNGIAPATGRTKTTKTTETHSVEGKLATWIALGVKAATAAKAATPYVVAPEGTLPSAESFLRGALVSDGAKSGDVTLASHSLRDAIVRVTEGLYVIPSGDGFRLVSASFATKAEAKACAEWRVSALVSVRIDGKGHRDAVDTYARPVGTVATGAARKAVAAATDADGKSTVPTVDLPVADVRLVARGDHEAANVTVSFAPFPSGALPAVLKSA